MCKEPEWVLLHELAGQLIQVHKRMSSQLFKLTSGAEHKKVGLELPSSILSLYPWIRGLRCCSRAHQFLLVKIGAH